MQDNRQLGLLNFMLKNSSFRNKILSQADRNSSLYKKAVAASPKPAPAPVKQTVPREEFKTILNSISVNHFGYPTTSTTHADQLSKYLSAMRGSMTSDQFFDSVNNLWASKKSDPAFVKQITGYVAPTPSSPYRMVGGEDTLVDNPALTPTLPSQPAVQTAGMSIPGGSTTLLVGGAIAAVAYLVFGGKSKTAKPAGPGLSGVKRKKLAKKKTTAKKSPKKTPISASLKARAKREGGLTLDSTGKQTGRTKGKRADKSDAALQPGKRLSRNGKIYYESRKNRSDTNRKKRV